MVKHSIFIGIDPAIAKLKKKNMLPFGPELNSIMACIFNICEYINVS